MRQNRWDTVKLIGSKDGHYSISTESTILKEAEGRWFTSSDDLEELCIGHIKQNNLKEVIDQSSYTIVVKVGSSSYYLPFRKVK